MACEAQQLWSLKSLIFAFIDLTVAYALLSASALAFVASRFLIFFGLNLPCPCHGLFFFGIRSKIFCLNKLLFDFPIQKLADVALYVKKAYPFSGCICARTTSSHSIPTNDCSTSNNVLQINCDASSKDLIFRPEKYDAKGKAIARRGPKSRLRLHRKQVSGRGRNSSSSPYDHNRGEDLCNKDTSSSSLNLWGDDSQMDPSSSGEEKLTIHLLERALEEERAHRAMLYIELEKERSASATAADEAMSMILRLQEEKASMEMEATQYQRIMEERSAYEAEEMNVLVEILVRREKEKLFLEKEVEGYRKMASLEEVCGGDGDGFFGDDSLNNFCPPRAVTENQMGGDEPREGGETENSSPEEKIIVTCDGTDTGNPNSSSRSITGNGSISVNRSSNSEIKRPPRASMSCEDDEVALLLEKLKFVRDDRERISLLAYQSKNQELGKYV